MPDKVHPGRNEVILVGKAHRPTLGWRVAELRPPHDR
jgi:hypothetical protein